MRIRVSLTSRPLEDSVLTLTLTLNLNLTLTLTCRPSEESVVKACYLPHIAPLPSVRVSVGTVMWVKSFPKESIEARTNSRVRLRIRLELGFGLASASSGSSASSSVASGQGYS